MGQLRMASGDVPVDCVVYSSKVVCNSCSWLQGRVGKT